MNFDLPPQEQPLPETTEQYLESVELLNKEQPQLQNLQSSTSPVPPNPLDQIKISSEPSNE